ncbi:MAG TPA: AAA family ATPase [Acidisarcina sp.]
MDLKVNPDAVTLAVLAVGLDRETIELVLEVAATLPREIVDFDCGGYLSPARYQFFPQPVKSAPFCIALVDWDGDPAAAVETAAALHQSFYGKIAILAISASTDGATLRDAMRCGFTEVLAAPLDTGELADAFLRIEQRWPADAGVARNTARILAFFGAKGGVGTTTLLIHLGVYLSKFHNKKVLIIDHHLELGHVCLYLGLTGTQYDFYELLTNVGRLDKELLAGFTASHGSGVDVLASPNVHGAAPLVDPRSVELVLDFLSDHYDYILIDCETSFEPSNETIMERADQVYLVATPDIGAIRDLSAFVDQLVKTSQVKATMHVVMNRYGSREAVSIEQIEKAIRLPISIRVPNSFAELINAINIGELVMPGKKSLFAEQMTKWSDAVVGVDQASAGEPVGAGAKKKSFWSKGR